MTSQLQNHLNLSQFALCLASAVPPLKRQKILKILINQKRNYKEVIMIVEKKIFIKIIKK